MSWEKDKFAIIYLWFLSLLGALFYGHVIGYMQGQQYEKDHPKYHFEKVPMAFKTKPNNN